MIIDNTQFITIEDYLVLEGIKNRELRDDLIDHFSCVIEEYLDAGNTFEEAFEGAKKRIAPDGVRKIEDDLNYLLTVNNQIMLRKIVFILGYISVFQIITAFAIFLPGFIDRQVAAMVAMSGIFIFSLSVVPFYFYQMYKKSVEKLQST